MAFVRYLHIRFLSPEPERILTVLAQNGLLILDTKWKDSLTIYIRIRRNQYSLAKQIFEAEQICFHIIRKTGFLWKAVTVMKRPVLLAGMILFLAVAVFLPNRILFFNVSGNNMIPDEQILYYAQLSGMGFFSRAAVVRSENVKNQLLSMIPQLQWVGVTTSGCCATIHVYERSDTDAAPGTDLPVSDIISDCEGVITQMTVYSGTPQVSVGQAVAGGDVLVSGYIDYGQIRKVCAASAEVFAHTKRNGVFITLNPSKREGEETTHTCYKVQIGKKVINLCNHSRISNTSCVKMYSVGEWFLSGGYQLPVSVIKQTYSFYQSELAVTPQKTIPDWLPAYACEYMQERMVAGEILRKHMQWEHCDGRGQLTVNYNCHEMIGRSNYEEITVGDAEDN